MVAELLHSGENKVGTCHEEFFVRQRTCVDSHCEYLSRVASTNTQWCILDNDALEREKVTSLAEPHQIRVWCRLATSDIIGCGDMFLSDECPEVLMDALDKRALGASCDDTTQNAALRDLLHQFLHARHHRRLWQLSLIHI